MSRWRNVSYLHRRLILQKLFETKTIIVVDVSKNVYNITHLHDRDKMILFLLIEYGKQQEK
jgi:hypothetical protein